MKKLVFTTIVFVTGILLLTSCIDLIDNSVTGNGNVVSEKREIGSFDAIEASSGLNVFVKFGEPSNELEVVADSNLQQYIQTEVQGNVLRIKTERSIRHAKSKKIYVNAGTLRSIGVSSAADLKGENQLVTDEIRIEVSSAGDLDLDLEAGNINVEVSSSGDARLSGKTDKLVAETSSAGDLNAWDLEAAYCEANVSSAGDMDINVTGELSASASSAGTIRYKGNPDIKHMSSSSAGSISRR